MRILVVSADPMELARCTSALDPSVEVTTVTSAREARAQLAAAPVDVLVVDGDLRPKGGYSLLYELAAEASLGGTQRPPSVVLVERKEDLWLADWARADAVCAKPVDGFELRAIIERLASPVHA